MLSDQQIESMSFQDRAALARRLAIRNAGEPPHRTGATERRRFRFLLVITGCCAVMVPWIAVLVFTLPRQYTAEHWRWAWVGFDLLLLACLANTAWLTWRKRQALVPAALITATLLVCDAWFDVTTARSQDLAVAVASALLAELPLAALLVIMSHRVLRRTFRRIHTLIGETDPKTSLRRIPLFALETPDRPRR